MKRGLIAPLLLILAGLGLFFLFVRKESRPAPTGSIVVYCAANLKKPVEAIAKQYGEETGVEVQLQYGGTGTLLSQLQVARKGDLFIAADDGTVADARKAELINEVIPLVTQRPVVAVKRGNPENIKSLADLSREGIKFSLANPDAASISKIVRKLLGPQWESFAAKATVMKPTVTEVAADIQIGAVDAGIVWDATVAQFDGLELVEVAEFKEHREHASAAVLTACTQPQEALRFARYMAAPDRGGKAFQQSGFQSAGGDKWAVRPSLILYSGGVNRLAIEKVLQQFADREDVDLTTIFNGCGILCSAMKTMEDATDPKFPDVYYACDVCFVPPVAEHFPEAVMLTETEIVIAVPKGNPGNLKTLSDLARPGLRVGLCNAEQSTLGYMTSAMLRSSGLHESVRRNVKVEVPTADFLINQMRVGSLDAIVVYKVNVAPQAEHFDMVALPADKPRAVQPFAVRHDSPNRQLGGRLLTFLRNHKEAFESAGFVWRGDEKAVPSDRLEIPDWLKPAP